MMRLTVETKNAITQQIDFLLQSLPKSHRPNREAFSHLQEKFALATSLREGIIILLEIENNISLQINAHLQKYSGPLRSDPPTQCLDQIRRSSNVQAIKPYITFLTRVNRQLIELIERIPVGQWDAAFGATGITSIVSKISIDQSHPGTFPFRSTTQRKDFVERKPFFNKNEIRYHFGFT